MDILWQRLKELCSQSADGIYRANWDTFWLDTGGYTINSLGPWEKSGAIKLCCDNHGDVYSISIVNESL